MDPKWLTELLTTIITFKYKLAQTGTLLKSKLFRIWRTGELFQRRNYEGGDEDEEIPRTTTQDREGGDEEIFFGGLLRLLNNLDVVLPLDEERLLIPCLLPDYRPPEWPKALRGEGARGKQRGTGVRDNIVVRRSFVIREGKTLSASILCRLHGILLKIGTKCEAAWRAGCIVRHFLPEDGTELVMTLFKESILFPPSFVDAGSQQRGNQRKKSKKMSKNMDQTNRTTKKKEDHDDRSGNGKSEQVPSSFPSPIPSPIPSSSSSPFRKLISSSSQTSSSPLSSTSSSPFTSRRSNPSAASLGKRRDAIHIMIGRVQRGRGEEGEGNFPNNVAEIMRNLVYSVSTLLSEFSFGASDVTQIIPLDERVSDWLVYEEVQRAVVDSLHSSLQSTLSSSFSHFLSTLEEEGEEKEDEEEKKKERERDVFQLESVEKKERIEKECALLLCPDLEIGDCINLIQKEKLELGETLGSGSFGYVQKALWKRKGEGGKNLNEKVAVKQLLETTSGTNESDWREALSSLQREIYLNSVCKHPNIVALRGICFCEIQGTLFIMEYLRGGDLCYQLSDPSSLFKNLSLFFKRVNEENGGELIECGKKMDAEMANEREEWGDRLERLVEDVRGSLKSKNEVREEERLVRIFFFVENRK